MEVSVNQEKDESKPPADSSKKFTDQVEER